MTDTTGLQAANVSVRFGGVTALDSASLAAPRSSITGLIGPNGAGKTTLFNACTGLVPLADGTVHLSGRDISSLPTSARARLGLGRTFQRMELYEALSVRENIEMGYEAARAGRNPLRQLLAPAREATAMRERAADAASICGIDALTDHPVGSLSTGQRRLVELARVLAGDFEVILLDEPSSGLDRTETARFGDILVELLDRRPVAILLVEHDMELVMAICERLFVLDGGRMIFEGDPAEVRANDAVRTAYLGTGTGGAAA